MPRKENTLVTIDVSRVQSLLDKAERYHPENLCVKPVHVAMEYKTPIGKVIAFARNGMSRSTPKHSEWFRAENLLRLAQRIEDDRPEKNQLVAALTSMPGDKVISCHDLADTSGPICLKGFNFAHPNERAARDATFCPNQIAGCAERTALWWRPYLDALQNKVQTGEVLHVKDVAFELNPTKATIAYRVNSSKEWKTLEVDHVSPEPAKDSETTLIVGAVPCITCVRQIVRPPPLGARRIIINRMSRYVDQETSLRLIDEDDVASLNELGQRGVHVIFPATSGGHTAKVRR